MNQSIVQGVENILSNNQMPKNEEYDSYVQALEKWKKMVADGVVKPRGYTLLTVDKWVIQDKQRYNINL